MVSFLGFSLFGVEIDWPSAGLFFAYSTVFLLPLDLEILANKNQIENKISRSIIDLFIGAINSIILGILHWTFSNDLNLVVASWFGTLYLGYSMKNRLAPPLKNSDFNG